jgi:tryptophan synthase alpha subunit
VCRYLAATAAATGLPVAAGFGIRTADQVRSLAGHAALAIVGSGQLAVIRAALETGADPVKAAQAFLQGLRA